MFLELREHVVRSNSRYHWGQNTFDSNIILLQKQGAKPLLFFKFCCSCHAFTVIVKRLPAAAPFPCYDLFLFMQPNRLHNLMLCNVYWECIGSSYFLIGCNGYPLIRNHIFHRCSGFYNGILHEDTVLYLSTFAHFHSAE